MNVVIGVRELRMAHVRAQIGNHNVQIFALVHPVVQPVGGKSVAKRVKGARGDLQGTQAGFIAVEICPGLQKSVIASQ